MTDDAPTESRGPASERDATRPTSSPLVPAGTPFHVAGVCFLLAGLVLALYQGLQAFALVPRLSWLTWTHIHFVTIGAFTQLIFGTLPNLAARKLERPTPSTRATRASFLGLNGALLLAWYGRAVGIPLAFDIGLAVVWLLALWLFALVLGMARRADGRLTRDPTVGFYLLSPFVYLLGLAFAFGLYSHSVSVPGGWAGLREAHVHANAWGFFGLAAIGTLYDLFPRLVDAEPYSDRLQRLSLVLFAFGIFPLVFGPVLGMGRSVTGVGLALYAGGYLLYAYTLVRTYLAGTPNGTAFSVLVAQFWVLAPASFAPFILFGVPLGIPRAWIETGALHFLFTGWALPVALAGSLLAVRPLERTTETEPESGTADRSDTLLARGSVPSVVGPATVLLWNAAVLAVGVGFFYREEPWSALLHGPGYTVLLGIWCYYVARIVGRRVRARPVTSRV
ncbi:cbb3-type cytochrome c oxidase subunit I [Natrinema marinum]|uniref:cbb3-type cytochrome c oxidase subunit I n=1 Tax=Natrinema marinum TaxID=2961598 RepID=UPI0020C87B2A|nr:cbb3-type cytochrome c oxidase subunit I [Natrinema marinum]